MSEDTTRICGYCHTGTHDKCRTVIRWYDKVWYCYCDCHEQEKEETNDDDILPTV
jgi:hypothetical protein